MRKSKWVVFKFLPYEYESLEKYLESMALRGWKLEKIFGYYIKFKKIEPQSIKYSVDVIDSVSFFDGKNSKNILEYREYCKEAGWEFVCEREKIQVYCSKENIKRIPIHTDDDENVKCIFRASLKYIFLNLITMLLFIFTQYMNIKNSTYFLTNNLSLITIFIVAFLVLSEIIEVISFLLWIINNKFSIYKCTDTKLTRVKKYIYNFGIFLTFIMIIFVILSGEMAVAKIIVMNLLLAYGFYKFKDFIEGSSIKKKRTTNIIAYISIGVITFIMLNTLIFKDMLEERSCSNETSVITLEDFNDKPNNDKSSSYISKDSSVLASRAYYSVQGENMHLSYELFESKYNCIINYKIKCIKDDLNRIGINYRELKTSLPEEVTVLTNENSNIYYILLENKVLEFHNFENYNNMDDLLKIAYEKII